jgi:perosamine synthetase
LPIIMIPNIEINQKLRAQHEPGGSREGMIPLCVPQMGGNEWKYVKECLDTNWISSVGPFVDRFESDIKSYLDVESAVATSSGTAALHLALLVAGVQADDEVLVSTLSFIAPANAIRYVGAWPVFIDAEPNYWQMDPQRVADFIQNQCQWRDGSLWNRITGRRIRAILPVHILGHPVAVESLVDLARKYDLRIIEDATESLGAKYQGQMVGTLGDIACLSFNGNKIISTGGGGMLVTNNQSWARKAKYLSTQAKDDPIEYIHNEIGFNYRLTNVQAAMGCAQLECLDEFVAKKRQIASTYASALRDIPGLTLMPEAVWAFSSYWLYTILIDPDLYGMNSRALLNRLAENNIQARPLWQPLHCSPIYADLPTSNCLVAEQLNSRALSLPSSVGLTPDQQNSVIANLIGNSNS